jgi:hypothetical protein
VELQLASSYLADQERAAQEGECKGGVKNFLALIALFILSTTAPLRGQQKIAEDERFIKTMRIFVESEGLGGIFVPAYICAHRRKSVERYHPGWTCKTCWAGVQTLPLTCTTLGEPILAPVIATAAAVARPTTIRSI